MKFDIRTFCHNYIFVTSIISNETWDPCIDIVNSRPDIGNVEIAIFICIYPELVALKIVYELLYFPFYLFVNIENILCRY